ncbi:D-glycerate dehydrogenase [Planococcus rifietoensis]|uniref:Glyoxylate/hydroxypyruvate reductase B n=1 Tax=Planococcus rifietoensis TaxID=200991 RepID=A0A0U2XJV3_9BACL|nr:D-glycerate dehydrogenase [Planococcus rifietoensis]ALS76448.1 D-glycerate dehydrogenase [Planococcus rifietoensis]
MKPKVFIAKSIPAEVEAYIGEYCDYKIWEGETPIPKEQLFHEVAEVEGLMTSKGVVTDEFLDHAPHLKIVSNIAAGYDTFDIEVMKRRNIIGTNTPNVLDDSVADHTMGMILMAARKLGELDYYVKQGKWSKLDDGYFLGKDVYNSRLGIIGMGNIGEKVAKRASLGFDMDVVYYNRSRRLDIEEKYGVRYAEMDELLKTADFVVVLLPLNPATQGIIGENEFKLMKKTAFFFNSSRGKLVKEQDLIVALQQGEIAGAGLDVYEVEPVAKDNPLLTMENVVTLPHMGSATEKTRFNMAMKAAENLVAGVTGKQVPNIVKELK